MSLVNLSHVCSHLQNASLARLGLTSIPYSKLHLSLSLLLHKQGFLSQVKLGGPSPPASCFPPGMRDSNNISSHPHQHGDGSMHSPESALQRVVDGPGPVTAAILREEGFNDEAITFAMEERLKSAAQLEHEGWSNVAANFLMRHGNKRLEQLQDEGMDEMSISFLQNHATLLNSAQEEVQRWYPDNYDYEYQSDNPNADERNRAGARRDHRNQQAMKLRERILREGFSAPTLRYFAGPQNSLRTTRDLARDGLTINPMGVPIPNQPFNPPPPPTQQDPWDLESEGVVTQANRASRRLWLGLKYWDNMPVLRKATMLSKPTKRIWLNARDLGGLTRGHAAAKGEIKPLTQVGECMAVSTDLGVMEVRECAERRVGGMVLCRVW
ncbi:uncharacterized protein LTR77_003480 [Saxophila tyrrhenica]|uniref:Ribosomal protein S8 n=1 Tax=Saxophila tyrrhenica TaxID=1690608 RepID=A0AAV9PEI0_9PEZI|nr:hypothetical protein LTR77_003480 [Saxophila tyrrhenica]